MKESRAPLCASAAAARLNLRVASGHESRLGAASSRPRACGHRLWVVPPVTSPRVGPEQDKKLPMRKAHSAKKTQGSASARAARA